RPRPAEALGEEREPARRALRHARGRAQDLEVTETFRYVVLDFDGTFTQVEREAEPFLRAYQEYLADVLGKDEDLVVDLWKIAEQRVRSEPQRFGGFEENGRIVAPPSDPYLRANAVARILCHRFNVLRNPLVRTETLQGIFRLAYRST